MGTAAYEVAARELGLDVHEGRWPFNPGEALAVGEVDGHTVRILSGRLQDPDVMVSIPSLDCGLRVMSRARASRWSRWLIWQPEVETGDSEFDLRVAARARDRLRGAGLLRDEALRRGLAAFLNTWRSAEITDDHLRVRLGGSSSAPEIIRVVRDMLAVAGQLTAAGGS